ncbi:GTA head formation protein, RCAP_rcc01685 family [Primorskyibacter sp. S187A]|uniref:GTA head formation protein, RCAP_rcc01685 family n=1 Tax=Primorskyibacter sp. S187A TaxID=3415130 RepID=UPI003C7DFC74
MNERAGFEAFDCAPALRLQAHERVSELQIEALNQRLDRIEDLMERMERRLWLTVYGVVAAILGQAFQSLLVTVPV